MVCEYQCITHSESGRFEQHLQASLDRVLREHNRNGLRKHLFNIQRADVQQHRKILLHSFNRAVANPKERGLPA